MKRIGTRVYRGFSVLHCVDSGPEISQGCHASSASAGCGKATPALISPCILFGCWILDLGLCVFVFYLQPTLITIWAHSSFNHISNCVMLVFHNNTRYNRYNRCIIYTCWATWRVHNNNCDFFLHFKQLTQHVFFFMNWDNVLWSGKIFKIWWNTVKVYLRKV